MNILFLTKTHFLNVVQIVQPKSALVVVDIQNDFISGSLASPGAAEVELLTENGAIVDSLDIY